MYECAQAGHGEVQHVAENQYHDAEHPVHAGYRDIQYHGTHDVERIAEHTSGKTERIQTDVAEDVAHKAGNHVIGIPET